MKISMVGVGATRGRSGGGGGGSGGGSGVGGGGSSGNGGGGGGGGQGSAGEEGKVCSVAWQRQHVHHQQHNSKTSIKLAAQGGDCLPVVELKPFTKKVWRREKSLPIFYDKPVIREDPVSETERNPRNGAPPDIVRYIRELSEQQKTVDTRQSVDSTQRYRSKLHPKTDFSFEGWSIAEHQQDIIPSFISRQERTKTLLAEDNNASGGAVGSGNGGNAGNVSDRSTGGGGGGGAVGREVSNLMATYTRDKPLQQQQVCLTGDKLPMANGGRRQLTYLNPFSTYRQRQPWTAAVRSEPNQGGLSPRHHHLSLANAGRLGGLLAMSANGHLPRRELVLSGSSFCNPERAPLQPLKTRHSSSPHKFHNKLGAAQDSLMTLGRTGVPTVVERNLSFDQEIRLERCRRERSFAAISETNIMSTAHYVAYDTQPTRGEVNLMRAREANKLPDGAKATFRRNGLQKPIGPLPPFGHSQSSSMFRQMMDDSPRSVQSDVGDSGTRSSPEESREEMARADLTDGVLIAREKTIPEHPSEFEKSDLSPELRQGGGVDSWVPKDSLLVPTVPREDSAESSEEYRRPLSDTAATEAVHIRNELTPMSAENRARLLPRDDSYLETVDSERELTPHRKRREGFVAEAKPSNVSDSQELSESASGAETTSDSVARQDRQAEAGPPVHSQQRAAQTDPPHQRDQTEGGGVADSLCLGGEGGSVADTDSSVQVPARSAAPENTVFTVVRSGSRKRERTGTPSSVQAGSGDRTADAQHTTGRQELQLVSVNSNAPSCGQLDSAREPLNPSPPKAGEGQGTASHAEAPSVKTDSGGEKDTPTRDVASETVMGSADNGHPPEATQQQASSHDTSAEKQQEPQREENSLETENKPADLSAEDQKRDQGLSDQEKGDSASSDSHQPSVLDNERNVSKTLQPPDEGRKSAASSRPSASRQSKSSGSGGSSAISALSSQSGVKTGKERASAGDSQREQTSEAKSPQEESENKKSEGGGEESQASSDGSKDTVTDTPQIPTEDGSQNVETIVTVTMETVPKGDNFDGSKTFLTTTNVEAEDYQNLVKV